MSPTVETLDSFDMASSFVQLNDVSVDVEWFAGDRR